MASKERRQAKGANPKTVRICFATEPDTAAEERIRMQAFDIYEKRRDGGVAGDSMSDWLLAESELNRVARPSGSNHGAPKRGDA